MDKESEEEKGKPGASGNSTETSGKPGHGAEGGGKKDADTSGTGPKTGATLEDLIEEHTLNNPPGDDDDDEEEEEETSGAEKTEEEKKKKQDETQNKILTQLFVGSFLLRMANRICTGLNVMLFNTIMKRRGKEVSFDKVMLTEKELKPLNYLIDRYGTKLIEKYLPPWAQMVIMIEGTYLDKMIMYAEPIKKKGE